MENHILSLTCERWLATRWMSRHLGAVAAHTSAVWAGWCETSLLGTIGASIISWCGLAFAMEDMNDYSTVGLYLDDSAWSNHFTSYLTHSYHSIAYHIITIISIQYICTYIIISIYLTVSYSTNFYPMVFSPNRSGRWQTKPPSSAQRAGAAGGTTCSFQAWKKKHVIFKMFFIILYSNHWSNNLCVIELNANFMAPWIFLPRSAVAGRFRRCSRTCWRRPWRSDKSWRHGERRL